MTVEVQNQFLKRKKAFYHLLIPSWLHELVLAQERYEIATCQQFHLIT